MWLLKNLKDDASLQYLLHEKKHYTVGRKNSDIILNDSSISRSHCVINIAPKRECPFTVQTHTGVWVIDKKSKYGTYVQKNHEWVRLDEEQIAELADGIIIRFGLMENIWRLEYKPLIVCTSRLSAQQTQDLKSQLAAVDGKLLGKWTKQCTTVIVNDVTLTIKVLLALINGIPIVTTNYLKKVTESVQQNQPLPDCREFKPKIAESTLVSHLVSLDPEDNRKELFKGKTFVIPREEQLMNLREIIEAAGGSVQLLKLDGNWRKLSDENTIVVQLPCNKIINPDCNAQAFKNLSNVLKNEYRVRVIPETEIYHAIAYSSVDKYCNPKCQAFEIRHSSYNHNSCGDIIQEETPTQSHFREVQQNPTSSITKEPSLLEEATKQDFTPSRKRAHSPELNKESKKPASDILPSNADADYADLFCGTSKDKEDKPYESVEKDIISNNLETLRITIPDAVDHQGVDSFSEKSSNKNCSLNFRQALQNFLDFTQKSNRRENEKRKLRTAEKSEFAPVEKRKRLEYNDTTPVNVEEKSVQEPSPNQDSEIEPKMQQKPNSISLGDVGYKSMWYIRKNADKCNRYNDDPPGVVGSFGNFKKKERYIPDQTVSLSEERIEEIGRTLLAQGWHLSRCARKSTSDSKT